MTKFNNQYRIDSTRLKNWNYSGTGKYFITICTRFREKYFGEIIKGEMKLNGLGIELEQQWLLTPDLRPDMVISLDTFQVMPNHFHGIIEIGWNKFNNQNLISDSICKGNSVRRIFGNRDIKPFCCANELDNRNYNVIKETTNCLPTHTDEFHSKHQTIFSISELNSELNCNPAKAKKPKGAFKNTFGPQRKNLGSVIRGFKSSVTTFARKNSILFNWQPKYHDVIIRDDVALNKIRNYIRNNPAKWENDRHWK